MCLHSLHSCQVTVDALISHVNVCAHTQKNRAKVHRKLEVLFMSLRKRVQMLDVMFVREIPKSF